MATGVKTRDDDPQMTRNDLDALQDAMKNKKFRDLLVDYFEEIRDPANQAIYQKEMTQLEKERGYDVTFINPKGGYVIKTSVAGDRKAFINICSNENVDKPSCSVKEINGQKGMDWSIPYSLIPPREDYDQKRQKCVIYDVVYHPDTLRMAEVNKRFRELVNQTAFDGLKKTYNIELDCNNFRFPKSFYKGMTTPAVIRKEDPNYQPPSEEETSDLNPDLIEKLYPQCNYPQEAEVSGPVKSNDNNVTKTKLANNTTNNSYTVPKYVIKQQKTVDMQDFTFDKNSKQYSAIPSLLVININLPLLSSTKDCMLDVQEKKLSVVSEKPAKYKLDINLPYLVDDQCGNAKFDKAKRILTVTLPVKHRKQSSENSINCIKSDSGVESEGLSEQSDEENSRECLITELSSTEKTVESFTEKQVDTNEEPFLDTSLGYLLPPYTHNTLDSMVAFTFHVKNTEPDSVAVRNLDDRVQIKFTSIGASFVPVHYTAIIYFDAEVKIENVDGEAWDNNVILQIQFAAGLPLKYKIGLSEETLVTECLEVTSIDTSQKLIETEVKEEENIAIVEVVNSANETSIMVSSNTKQYEEETQIEFTKEKSIQWVEDSTNEISSKSILRNRIARSLSESSVGDVASSMDYISSDCIPEESSLKKTVRFNDVIAKQFYRYNSSIEGQKKKNQRKKSKKRNLERRKSESEAEDDANIIVKANKPATKSKSKQRRDSGLADTSDAETSTPVTSPTDIIDNYGNGTSELSDLKEKSIENNGVNIINRKKESNSAYVFRDSNKNVENGSKRRKDKSESITCDNIKHNTDLYNPDKLNKGQYTDVKFKNDLIFDLDM